jgi:CRISPR system Cascade subunit CasC
MFIELHLLQNFAPSCLNRDDTNSPKDCVFGGHRRARISSQCTKRAIRTHFQTESLLPAEFLAVRTKRLVDEIAERLAQPGQDITTARAVAETAVKGWGLGVKDQGRTEYLLFLGRNEIEALASACRTHWDALCSSGAGTAEAAGEGKDKDKKQQKRMAKAAVPAEFGKAFQTILDGGKAVDLGMFGRMLADLPDKNRDAACQVAYAISTHQVSTEFDFFTAVDDLAPKEETGAGMMGNVEFNSACFYRYANIDLNQLTQNLGGDAELAKKGIEAFIRAAVGAIPSGKQNSMAAQNPPSLVFAVARERGLWSLANAFVNPVRPDGQSGLVEKSVTALENYWVKLAAAYGEKGIRAKALLVVDGDLQKLKDYQAPNLEALIQAMMTAMDGGQP